MANKKCPKCGEDNPAEAVMCWACYTPLTAGAGAAMGAGAGIGGAGATTMPRPGGPMGIPGGAGTEESSEKKQTDPKIFVLIGLIAVGGIIALFTSGALGGSAPAETTTDTTVTESTVTGAAPPPAPPVVAVAPVAPVSPSGPSNPVAASTPPPPSYTTVVPANPGESIGTMGIAPPQPVSKAAAVNLARQARREMANGKWTGMQIFVFTSPDAAQSFRQFMSARRGKPLGGTDYASLAQQGAWTGAQVFYGIRGKQAKIAYPADSPTNWWGNIR